MPGTVAVKGPMYEIRLKSQVIRGIGGIEEAEEIINTIGGAYLSNSYKLSQRIPNVIHDPNVTADFKELEDHMIKNPPPLIDKHLRELPLTKSPEKNRFSAAWELLKLYLAASETGTAVTPPPFFRELKSRGVFEENREIEDVLGVIEDLLDKDLTTAALPDIAVYGEQDLNRFALIFATILHFLSEKDSGQVSEPPFFAPYMQKTGLSFDEAIEHLHSISSENPTRS